MKWLLVLFLPLLLSACRRGPSSRAMVDRMASLHDPSRVALDDTSSHVRQGFLPDNTIMGIITLADGAKVKYWFVSHHLSRDIGCTRFQFENGDISYLKGYFCCETEFPNEPFPDRKALEKFIAAKDGIRP